MEGRFRSPLGPLATSPYAVWKRGCSQHLLGEQVRVQIMEPVGHSGTIWIHPEPQAGQRGWTPQEREDTGCGRRPPAPLLAKPQCHSVTSLTGCSEFQLHLQWGRKWREGRQVPVFARIIMEQAQKLGLLLPPLLRTIWSALTPVLHTHSPLPSAPANSRGGDHILGFTLIQSQIYTVAHTVTHKYSQAQLPIHTNTYRPLSHTNIYTVPQKHTHL